MVEITIKSKYNHSEIIQEHTWKTPSGWLINSQVSGSIKTCAEPPGPLSSEPWYACRQLGPQYSPKMLTTASRPNPNAQRIQSNPRSFSRCLQTINLLLRHSLAWYPQLYSSCSKNPAWETASPAPSANPVGHWNASRTNKPLARSHVSSQIVVTHNCNAIAPENKAALKSFCLKSTLAESKCNQTLFAMALWHTWNCKKRSAWNPG